MKQPAQWTMSDPRHFKEGYTLKDGKQVTPNNTPINTNTLPIIKR